jgi:hypothetical protein
VWGDVTPAERLRAITRRSRSDHDLAVEAADALAGFAVEPAHLVVACRRVLAHLQTNAVLWWVCARILSAPDAAAAAREAAGQIENDRTASRLAATIPLLDDGEVFAALGWPDAVDSALAERQDVDAVAIRVDGYDLAPALRYRRTDRSVRVVDEWSPVLERVRVLAIAAEAIGPERALVPAGTRNVLATVKAREVWLVGGVGRVLPGRLFDAAAAAAERDPDAEFDVISLEAIDRVAGPRGVESPADAGKRVDCPVAPELLRPLD